jgi:hypothetical protein
MIESLTIAGVVIIVAIIATMYDTQIQEYIDEIENKLED